MAKKRRTTTWSMLVHNVISDDPNPTRLLTYGTLRNRNTIASRTHRNNNWQATARDAIIRGFVRIPTTPAYVFATDDPTDVMAGVLWDGLDADDFKYLDIYEGYSRSRVSGNHYERITILADDGKPCELYVAGNNAAIQRIYSQFSQFRAATARAIGVPTEYLAQKYPNGQKNLLPGASPSPLAGIVVDPDVDQDKQEMDDFVTWYATRRGKRVAISTQPMTTWQVLQEIAQENPDV